MKTIRMLVAMLLVGLMMVVVSASLATAGCHESCKDAPDVASCEKNCNEALEGIQYSPSSPIHSQDVVSFSQLLVSLSK